MHQSLIRLSTIVAAALIAAGCGSGSTPDSTAATATETPATSVVETIEPANEPDSTDGAVNTGEATATFQIDVWADNWSAVYIDGVLVGEDSVSITTERSFNAESYMFEAATPFTVAIEAKDFKETDSGIEYIGERNQQMGDGGIIAQITNVATGEVVAVTNDDWSALVVHQAPLNTECVRDTDPDATCEFLILDTPTGWTTADFDDSAWVDATVWSAADVSPKDGYDEISWDNAAQLIWGTDLEVDNTVLLRTTVS